MRRVCMFVGGLMVLAAATVGAELMGPAPANAQDWDVRGGQQRRQKIIGRYKKLLEKNPVEGLILKKLVAYVGGRGDGLDGLVDDYRHKVDGHPDNAAYRLVLGHLLKKKNDYQAALVQYDKAVELGADNSTAWLSRGSAQMLLQHQKKASADFEKALALEKNKDRKQKILRKLADVAFAQHDWERAESFYDKLVALDPNSDYLRMEYAQVLVKYKRYQKALAQYDKLIELAGRDTKKRATTLRDKADVYERMGQPKKAVATYRKAMGLMRKGHWLHNELRHRVVDVYRSMDKLDELAARYQKNWRHPNYNESMILAGLYDELGDDTHALKYFRRATKQNRRKADPRLKIIRILQRRGEDAAVIDAYRDLIRMAPNQERFRFDLVQLYFRLGQRKQAVAQLKRIGRRFRSDPSVYLKLADTYMRYQMRNKAQKAYERLVRLEPDSPSYVLSLGEFYYRSSNLEKAKKTWKRLLDTRLKKPQAYARLGDTYAEHGLLDQGVSYYEKAVELAPEDRSIRRGLAVAYGRARRFDKAVRAWRYLLDNAQGADVRAQARGHIIRLWEQRGRLKAKMDDYKQAFEADEPDEQAGYFLAEAHLKRNEYAEAETVYRRLIDLDGQRDAADVDAFQALLRIYEQRGQQTEAVDILETLAQLKPKLAREYYHKIAELSLELYQDDKAVAYGKRAVEQNPDDATAHAQLGDVYRKMGRPTLAVKQYRQAVDLDPRAFGNYLKLADLDMQLGELAAAENLYRRVAAKSESPSQILEAGRRAIKLAEADGRLSELEVELSPLAFGGRARSAHLKLMLELYDRMVSPLVDTLRYGVADADAGDAGARRRTLARQALPVLRQALQSDDVGLRATSVGLLGDLEIAAAASDLARIGVDRTDSLRSLAIIAVARVGAQRASPVLVDALDDDDPQVRDMATWALGYTGGASAVDGLVEVLDAGQHWTQQALAAISLGRIGTAPAVRALQTAFDAAAIGRGSDKSTVAVVWAMGRSASKTATADLRRALDDGTGQVRAVAASSLANIGSGRALEALLNAYWTTDRSLRDVGRRGLAQIRGRHPAGSRKAGRRPSDEQATDGQATGADGAARRAKLAAREVSHDIQYIDTGRHRIDSASIIDALRQDARAVDVTPAAGFVAAHLATIAATARRRLKDGPAAVRRQVLGDLVDMVDGQGFGVLAPTNAADRRAANTLVGRLHGQLDDLSTAEDAAVVRPAVELLGVVGDPADRPAVVALASSSDAGVRRAAVGALGAMGAPAKGPSAKGSSAKGSSAKGSSANGATAKVVETVKDHLNDQAFAVRAAAARALGQVVEPSDPRAAAAAQSLVDLLGDDYRSVRQAAADGLVQLGSPRSIQALGDALDSLSLSTRLVALRALAASDVEAAKQLVAGYVDHPDLRVRRAARGQ